MDQEYEFGANPTPNPGPGGQAEPQADGLAWLTEALDTEVPVPTIVVPVAARPGWAVKYRTNLAWHELQQWRKQAGDDTAFLSRLILAGLCVGFVKDGADVVDGDGRPVTFGTVMRKASLPTQADAVRTWLVTDGPISGTSDLVYERSGYRMPEVDDGDPTE